MGVLGHWETIYQASERIRLATGHKEFTTDNLRSHIESDGCATKTINGKVYVNTLYVDKLIYRLGEAGF